MFHAQNTEHRTQTQSLCQTQVLAYQKWYCWRPQFFSLWIYIEVGLRSAFSAHSGLPLRLQSGAHSSSPCVRPEGINSGRNDCL